MYDRVNDHVKERGLQGVPLSYPTVALEDSPIMPPLLCCKLDPGPVGLQYVERPGTHSIPHQDIQTSVSAQGVIVLAQVEEDGMEDRIPHGDDLLKQI